MKRLTDQALAALVLIRLGQELGSDSPVARAVHDFITALTAAAAALAALAGRP